MPKLRTLLIVALSILIVSACGSLERVRPSPVPSPAAPVSLLTIETRGGMCPNGLCGSLITIDSNGSVHEVRPTDRVIGQVSPDLLEALRIEIDRANFPLIESRPFTDTCPMAYDGQETIYVFTTGQGTGFERIASCEVVIDPNHPLFAAVAAIMRTVTTDGA